MTTSKLLASIIKRLDIRKRADDAEALTRLREALKLCGVDPRKESYEVTVHAWGRRTSTLHIVASSPQEAEDLAESAWLERYADSEWKILAYDVRLNERLALERRMSKSRAALDRMVAGMQEIGVDD